MCPLLNQSYGNQRGNFPCRGWNYKDPILQVAVKPSPKGKREMMKRYVFSFLLFFQSPKKIVHWKYTVHVPCRYIIAHLTLHPEKALARVKYLLWKSQTGQNSAYTITWASQCLLNVFGEVQDGGRLCLFCQQLSILAVGMGWAGMGWNRTILFWVYVDWKACMYTKASWRNGGSLLFVWISWHTTRPY